MPCLCGGQRHNRADIPLPQYISKQTRMSTDLQAHQSVTHFSFNRQGIKEPTLRTQSQLHNVFCCPHFTICVPFIPSSWRGTADSLSSAPRPLCLISVIQLMRLGLWQAAGTHTKGSSTEMCPEISVSRIVPPHLTQQPTLKYTGPRWKRWRNHN